MKIWLRIGVSFLIVFIFVATVWLIKVQKIPVTPTGDFVLSTASIAGILLGFTLLLITLYQLTKEAKRKTETITVEDVENRLREKTTGVKPEYLEGKLLFDAGDFASYVKRRGVSRGGLSETGTYKVYEVVLYGIQRRAKELLEKHSQLKYSYVLPLLEKVHPAYADKVLELLAETTEAYKRINLGWINKKGLKRLASIIEKYVR